MNDNARNLVSVLVILLVGTGLAVAGGQGSDEAAGLPVFAWCGIAAIVVNTLGFLHSLATRTERYFDLLGSVTYISMVLVALLASEVHDARSVIAGTLVLIWAGRLGTFLFRRISRDGEDRRFRKILADPLRLLMTWALQALWAFLTAAGALAIITAEGDESFDAFAVVGIALWIVGFVIEVVADTQKSAFRADPANAGRFISTGIWAWSRHPNYFGEIVLWFGVAIMALPILEGWRFVTLASPVFVFVLLTRISGVPMLERRGLKQWGDEPAYQAYLESTPALVLRPPR